MFKNIRRIILEAKIRGYAEAFEYYKHKTLKQQYYDKKVDEYYNKINDAEENYKKLIDGIES